MIGGMINYLLFIFNIKIYSNVVSFVIVATFRFAIPFLDMSLLALIISMNAQQAQNFGHCPLQVSKSIFLYELSYIYRNIKNSRCLIE